jgi:hypothetical protein
LEQGQVVEVVQLTQLARCVVAVVVVVLAVLFAQLSQHYYYQTQFLFNVALVVQAVLLA